MKLFSTKRALALVLMAAMVINQYGSPEPFDSPVYTIIQPNAVNYD